MTNDVELVFEWRLEGDAQLNKCRIRICWVPWEKAIIIATNITSNPGRNVSNATKEIINFVSNEYNLVSNKIMFVEHYSINNSRDEDIYLQVLLTGDKALRSEIDRSKLVELIGKPI